MTICSMVIEGGARVDLDAIDDVTIAYMEGRPQAPTGAAWNAAITYWRTLQSDAGAMFDRTVVDIDATALRPMVSWGTLPRDGRRD